MTRIWKNFLNGLWDENPTFRILIGLCPTLAVTTSAINGFSMGLATTFVILCSSVLISILRSVIPSKVRSRLILSSSPPLLPLWIYP